MWVARDEDGTLHLSVELPIRNKDFWGMSGFTSLELDKSLFSDLTWKDEPREVKLMAAIIDERKLDKLAEDSSKNQDFEIQPIWRTAFRLGYRTAKNE